MRCSAETEVLTVSREEVGNTVQSELQKILDRFETGIQIVTVKLQDVNAPDPVKAAFSEVNGARQEKERMINQAQEAFNKEIPKATGQARKTIAEMEGYATAQVYSGFYSISEGKQIGIKESDVDRIEWDLTQ